MKYIAIMILTVLLGVSYYGTLHAARATTNDFLYTRHWHVESAKEENQACEFKVGDKVKLLNSIVWSGRLYVRLELLNNEDEECKGWTKPENYRQ